VSGNGRNVTRASSGSLGAGLQGDVHRLEAGARPPESSTERAHEQPGEALGLEGADGGLAGIAAAYRGFALENPHLYRLMTERALNRELLAPGAEARAAAPLIEAAGGDADLARAAWAFAHGMTILELNQRFPADADLDAAWSRGVEALSRPRSRG
jgi:hypothetical protein